MFLKIAKEISTVNFRLNISLSFLHGTQKSPLCIYTVWNISIISWNCKMSIKTFFSLIHFLSPLSLISNSIMNIKFSSSNFSHPCLRNRLSKFFWSFWIYLWSCFKLKYKSPWSRFLRFWPTPFARISLTNWMNMAKLF